MTQLLVVHHTPSPAMQELLEATAAGAHEAATALNLDLEVVLRPALSAGAADVLAADAIILGTPANIGYMSGAMKHFFDTIYYPCLNATVGLPFTGYIHGNDSTEGAVQSILKIVTALRWKPIRPLTCLVGAPDAAARQACHELGEIGAAAALGAL